MKRICLLFVVTLSVAAWLAQGARGSRTGATSIPVIGTFRDSTTIPDRIKSDGLGTYVDGQNGVRAVIDARGDFDLDTSTAGPGGRTLFVDLSSCVSTSCNAPFATQDVDAFMSTGVGGLPNMAQGSSTASSLAVNFVTPSTPNTQWFLRFNPNAYPGTSTVTVTRGSASTWTIEAVTGSTSCGAMAKLLSAPTTGKLILTDRGNFCVPFEVTVSLKQ